MYAYPVTVSRHPNGVWRAEFENLNWQAEFQCERPHLTKAIRDEIDMLTGNPDAAVAIRIV